MNREAIDIVVALTTIFLVFAIVLLLKWLINSLERRFNKIGWLHDIWEKIISITIYGLYGLIFVFVIWLLISIFFSFVEKIEAYKTADKQRLEFLKTNCHQVDEDYAILNDGKSFYKCPNGKEYKY